MSINWEFGSLTDLNVVMFLATKLMQFKKYDNIGYFLPKRIQYSALKL